MQENGKVNSPKKAELTRGDVQQIADLAECSPEYASAILNCNPKYKQTGKIARKIWMAYNFLLEQKNLMKEEFQTKHEAVG